MRLFRSFTSHLALISLLCADCDSTPVHLGTSERTHDITFRTVPKQPGRDLGETSTLLPRLPGPQYLRYRVIALTIGAFIIPAPLTQVMRVADHFHYTWGPMLYEILKQTAHYHWGLWENGENLRFILGKFEFLIYVQPGHTIPLDFLDRFCDTMILYATNGFFTLYNVMVMDMYTGVMIGVELRLREALGDDFDLL